MILTTISAYCACQLCCGPHAHGVCANGSRPVQGVTVAASRKLPLGTRIRVGGHTYTVNDRLARRYDDRVDIYFASHEVAKKFGVKRLRVTIVSAPGR